MKTNRPTGFSDEQNNPLSTKSYSLFSLERARLDTTWRFWDGVVGLGCLGTLIGMMTYPGWSFLLKA